MTSRRWTILIVVFFVGFLIPELYGYFSGTVTLSQANWAWSDAWWPFGLVVSFSVGLLLGHLFWARKILAVAERTYGDERLVRPYRFVDEPYDEAFDSKSLKENEDSIKIPKRRSF